MSHIVNTIGMFYSTSTNYTNLKWEHAKADTQPDEY